MHYQDVYTEIQTTDKFKNLGMLMDQEGGRVVLERIRAVGTCVDLSEALFVIS